MYSEDGRLENGKSAEMAGVKGAFQGFHLLYACTLTGNDGRKDGKQIFADREAECIFRHLDGSFMVRNHFTQEVSADAVVRAGIFHARKHCLRN